MRMRKTPKVSLSIKATEAAASWKRQTVSSPKAFRGGSIKVQRFSALVTSRAIKEQLFSSKATFCLLVCPGGYRKLRQYYSL